MRHTTPDNSASTSARRPARDRVPLRYARTMLRVAEEQGYDSAALLRSLDLPFDPLSRRADLDSLIDARHYSLLYRRVMSLLQDESFGLGLRQKTPAGSFRMLALFIIHCETLEQALRRTAEFVAFCRTLSDMPGAVPRPVERLTDGLAVYRFPAEQDLAAGADRDSRYAVAHAMAVWRRFCQWLIGKSIELRCVRLQSAASADEHYFETLFGCDIEFGGGENALVFAEHYLDCPLAQTEESLRRFLRNAPYHLYVAPDEDDVSLLAQMTRLVGGDLSREFPSVVNMAEHLNMSVRTLRRRLKDLDTTYQEFKDNLRREHAVRWLNQPELKINAVSALLGFDEPSAFHRSFKKWTGMTPGEYRARQHMHTGSSASDKIAGDGE